MSSPTTRLVALPQSEHVHSCIMFSKRTNDIMISIYRRKSPWGSVIAFSQLFRALLSIVDEKRVKREIVREIIEMASTEHPRVLRDSLVPIQIKFAASLPDELDELKRLWENDSAKENGHLASPILYPVGKRLAFLLDKDGRSSVCSNLSLRDCQRSRSG
ncbi:hypothetical protein BDDG_00684 [Blastomyces dermatitidis ATCC 18188]|nr:hypothetical protein BDDG_00684 [Blastomyces dermatitidis ATCC 18188]